RHAAGTNRLVDLAGGGRVGTANTHVRGRYGPRGARCRGRRGRAPCSAGRTRAARCHRPTRRHAVRGTTATRRGRPRTAETARGWLAAAGRRTHGTPGRGRD